MPVGCNWRRTRRCSASHGHPGAGPGRVAVRKGALQRTRNIAIGFRVRGGIRQRCRGSRPRLRRRLLRRHGARDGRRLACRAGGCGSRNGDGRTGPYRFCRGCRSGICPGTCVHPRSVLARLVDNGTVGGVGGRDRRFQGDGRRCAHNARGHLYCGLSDEWTLCSRRIAHQGDRLRPRGRAGCAGRASCREWADRTRRYVRA